MSRLARAISESGVYHILFRGVNQQNIFEEDADFNKLKETITTVKQDLEFEIYAYCFKGISNQAAAKNYGNLKGHNNKSLKCYQKMYVPKWLKRN